MKSNFTYLKHLFLICCFLFSSTTFAQTSWLSLGADDHNQPIATVTSNVTMAIHPITGETYVAFTAHATPIGQGDGFVQKFNSVTAQWEAVGDSFSTGSSSSINISFNSTGILYIGYKDYDLYSTHNVKKFNSVTGLWEMVGTAIATQDANNFRMILTPDDTPYVFYTDATASNKGTVRKFNGSAWVTVGNAGFTPTSIINNSIAVSSTGSVYVAYSSWINSIMSASVMKFDGTSWQLVGNQSLSGGGTSNIVLKINPVTDEPYLCYTDFNSSYGATVKKFNGSTWELIGTANLSEGTASTLSMAFTSTGTLYIGYGNDRATVRKFNGSIWQVVGTQQFSIGVIGFCTVGIANDNPVVAFTDFSNGSRVTALKYNGNSWICLGGTQGLAEETVESSYGSSQKSFDLVVTANGDTYCGFREFSEGSLISVKKYNSTAGNWELAGNSRFSASESHYVSMAAHVNTPYIAYSDFYNNNRKITVKKLNGTIWELVGNAHFSAGEAAFNNLTIAPDGTPYVLFSDSTVENKVTVMKFNGTAWVLVGTAGFSEGIINSSSFVIGQDGTPFVAFGTSVDGNWFGIVKKFNGTAWEMVGETFSDGDVSPSLAIGPDGLLYVGFSRTMTDVKTAVKRFNGSTWEEYGPQGFSDGFAFNVNLAIKPDGQLFMSYIDASQNYKAVVKKYNGTNWISVVADNISEASATFPVFRLTPDGTHALLAYASYCIYAKTIDVTCTTEMPIAQQQSHCSDATVADLIASGENLKWFTSESFGTPLTMTAPLATGTYYASQMQNDCEGPRIAVSVTVNPVTPAPQGQTSQAIPNDDGNATLANLEVIGTELRWYDATGLLLPTSTTLDDGVTYFATQTLNGCESAKLPVTVQFVLGTITFNDTTIKYFPNPVANDLHIVSKSSIKKIEIYNLYGQRVNQNLNTTEGSITMSGLAKSTYFIFVYTETGIKHFTVMKQ